MHEVLPRLLKEDYCVLDFCTWRNSIVRDIAFPGPWSDILPGTAESQTRWEGRSQINCTETMHAHQRITQESGRQDIRMSVANTLTAENQAS